MISNIVILCVSLALFLYWLRYTCLLMLNMSESERQVARRVAVANRLCCFSIEPQLEGQPTANLEAVYRSLEQDYRFLVQLMKHAPGIDASRVERLLLCADFWSVRMAYRVGTALGLARCERAIREMADVVASLSNCLGRNLMATE